MGDGRIARALAYFESKLAELPGLSEVSGLQRFFALSGRLEFMCATLENDNAYNIFKSLNSTGVELRAADLIRNFVFMHLGTEKHDEFDRRLWAPLESHFTRTDGIIDDDTLSEFMRDFLMKDGRYVKEGRQKVFETFEDRYATAGFSPEALAVELNRFAGYYMVMRGEKFDRHEGVTAALEKVNALKVRTTYPLLLQLFERRNQGAISDEDMAKAIELLVGFVLRRYICELGARGYPQTFTKACSALGDGAGGLERHLLNNGHPDETRFRNAFVNFNLYESKYARFMLESLEKSRGHLEPAGLAAADIEHVMPQTLTTHWRHDLGTEADRIHATWLHTAGNLALSAYNETLANRPFSEKRLHYANSNIGITRELANFQRWGEAEIRQRGEAMAEAAAKIWSGPSQPFAPPGGDNGVRQLNPEAPPNLFHTDILEGAFGSTAVFNWRQLMDAAVKISSQRGLAAGILQQIAGTQDHQPGLPNFHQVEGTNLWLPGRDANQCWRRSFRLAQAANIDIRVLIEWHDAPEAAFPGEQGMLRWSPAR